MKRTFISILIAVSLIVSVEIYSTVHYSSDETDDRFVLASEYNSPYIYHIAPRIKEMSPMKGIDENRAAINNFGMRRSSDIAEDPRGDTKRILAYGDSITFGVLVSDQQNYPYFLERSLNANSRQQYEVLNMGRGYCPSIYAMFLKSNIVQFKPHTVIMQIELSNDITDEAHVMYDELDADGFPKKITKGRYWAQWAFSPPMSANPSFWENLKLRRFYMDLKRRSANLALKIFPNPLFSEEADTYYFTVGYDRFGLTEKRLSSAFDRMMNVIKAQQEFCKKNNIHFVLVIVPSRHTFYQNQYYKGAVRLVGQAETKARNLEIPYVSLRRTFQVNGGSDLYFDFCHLKPEGYELMANEIFQRLKAPRLGADVRLLEKNQDFRDDL